MSQLLPPGWENWIPLIAALWLASILLLIISARRYFASRALDREEAEPTPMQEPFIGVGRAPGILAAGGEIDTDVDAAPLWVAAPHDVVLPDADIGDQPSFARCAEDRNAAATISRELDSDGENVFAAVLARIARDRTSAQGLSELIRALYLDQSNFTFQTIAELNAEDRALAKGLIEEWLADPSAVENWEEIYDTVRESTASSLLQ